MSNMEIESNTTEMKNSAREAKDSLVLKKVINCGRVNVRADPSVKSDNILKTLGVGETILSSPEAYAGYYKVRLSARQYGYIQEKYLGDLD